MKELKFKRTEILVLDEWSEDKNVFKGVQRREGVVELVGAECKYYKVGDTILFEDKPPYVASFEYEAVKYLMMDEKSIIAQVS